MLEGKGISWDPFARRSSEAGVKAYVKEYFDVLEAYVASRYDADSEREVLQRLWNDPYVARTVIENFMTPSDERFARVIDYVEGMQTGVFVTIGAKRNWKTITTCDMLVLLAERTARPLYSVGQQTAVPPQFKRVATVNDINEKGAIIFWDEMGVDASARTTQTSDQRSLPGQLAIIGHNEHLLWGVTQNSAISDSAVISLIDGILVKPIGITQLDTERGALKKRLEFWKELLPIYKWESLFFCRDMNPWTFTRPIPDYWEEEYSHAYARFATWEKAVEHAAELYADGNGKGWKEIARRMAQRGWSRSKTTWQTHVERWIAQKGSMRVSS